MRWHRLHRLKPYCYHLFLTIFAPSFQIIFNIIGSMYEFSFQELFQGYTCIFYFWKSNRISSQVYLKWYEGRFIYSRNFLLFLHVYGVNFSSNITSLMLFKIIKYGWKNCNWEWSTHHLLLNSCLRILKWELFKKSSRCCLSLFQVIQYVWWQSFHQGDECVNQCVNSISAMWNCGGRKGNCCNRLESVAICLSPHGQMCLG